MCVETGLRLSAFHGNFFVRSTDLLAFSAVPIDQSYCIEVTHEDQLTTPFVVLQTGILYTSCYGASFTQHAERQMFTQPPQANVVSG
jgi:hypothetical protein